MVLGLLAKTFWARTLKSGVHMQASVMKMPLTLYIPTITSSLVTYLENLETEKRGHFGQTPPLKDYMVLNKAIKACCSSYKSICPPWAALVGF